MNNSSIFPPMITLFNKIISRSAYGVLLLSVCGLCAVLSCDEKKPAGLAADPDIKAIFTEAEIKDLTIILDFFEQQICDLTQMPPDSVLDCYQAFFINVRSAQATGVMYIPVPFHLQKEMYARLSDAAFTEIWLRGTGVNQVTGDTTQRLMLSFDGKYMDFLTALRRDYTILEAYKRTFTEERKITTVMIETLLYNFHLLNMNDVRIRLFVALHYLTLNDVFESKKE